MEINITGGVAEWLKVPHSKCGRGEILSEVRILPPPPVGKSEVWLALCEGSPADFRRKIEFFVFVPQSGTPEAGFSEF